MRTLSKWMKSAIGVVAALFVTGCHAEVKQDTVPESMKNSEVPEAGEQQNAEGNHEVENGNEQSADENEITPEDYHSAAEHEKAPAVLIYGPPSMFEERARLREEAEQDSDSGK